MEDKRYPQFANLPFGMAIAKVNLVDCQLMTDQLISSMMELEKLWGDWKPGRYAWKFEDIQLLDPTPVKGRQGFFEVDQIKQSACNAYFVQPVAQVREVKH